MTWILNLNLNFNLNLNQPLSKHSLVTCWLAWILLYLQIANPQLHADSRYSCKKLSSMWNICHQLTTLIETFNKLSATGSTLNSSQVQINPRPLEQRNWKKATSKKVISLSKASYRNSGQAYKQQLSSSKRFWYNWRSCQKMPQDNEETCQGKLFKKASWSSRTWSWKASWIVEQRRLKLSVSMKNIRARSSSQLNPLSHLLHHVSKFITRNKLSRRTPTHVMQQMRDGVVEEIKAWDSYSSGGLFWAWRCSKNLVFKHRWGTCIPRFISYKNLSSSRCEDGWSEKDKRRKNALLGTGFKLPGHQINPSQMKTWSLSLLRTSGWMDAMLFQDYIRRLLLNLVLPENTHLIRSGSHSLGCRSGGPDEWKSYTSKRVHLPSAALGCEPE